MPRTLSIAALLLLAASPAWADDVDRLLRRVRGGERLKSVPQKVGLQAVKRIDGVVSDATLGDLVKVARAAGIQGPLDRALLAVILEPGLGARAAARALADLPAERREAVLTPPPKAWGAKLRPLLRPPDAATDAAIRTLWFPSITADEITDLYRLLLREPRRVEPLLRGLDPCPPPAKLALFTVLNRSRPAPSLRDATIVACQDLAADPAVAERLIQSVKSDRLGPYDGFLHALGLVPPELWDRAASALLPYLHDEDPERQAAAILGGARMLRPEVLAELPRLLGPAAPKLARLAALKAIVPLGYRDAPTVRLLLGLFQDPDPTIRLAAHEALQKKAGVRLPLRLDSWETWLKSQNLPDAPPLEPEARLAKQQALARKQRAGQPTAAQVTRSGMPRTITISGGAGIHASPSDLANRDTTRATDRADLTKTSGEAAGPTAEGGGLPGPVLVGAAVVILALLGWVLSVVRREDSAPIKLALPERALVEEKRELLAKLPDPPTHRAGTLIAKQLYDNEEMGNTTRIERLQDVLDLKQAGMLDTVNGDDTQVIASFRAALKSVQRAHHHAPSIQTADAALAEIHKLGSGLGDRPIDTAMYEALQRKVESLQTRVDGVGLTEMARESCFLLLQVAHCLRAGAELPPKTAERWNRMLEDLGERVAESDPPADGRTLDTAALFGDPAPRAAPRDAGTLDVEAVFDDKPKDAGTLDVDQVFDDDRPRDAGTLDVDQVFDDGAPPAQRLDIAAVFAGGADPLGRARKEILDRVADAGTRAVVTYAFQQSYLQPLHVEGALIAAEGGPLLPHLRPLLTPQQVSELTVIYRRATGTAPPPADDPSEFEGDTAGFDSVFPDAGDSGHD